MPLPLKVLLVEDEPFGLHLQDYLRNRLHYEVTLVTNSKFAKTALENQKLNFNFAIVDLALESSRTTDGIDLIKWMRLKNHMFPVLVLTGLGNKATMFAAYIAGADDYLEKGFRFTDHLEARVDDMLEAAVGQKINALSRLYQRAEVRQACVKRGPFTMYEHDHIVLVEGRPLQSSLTTMQFSVLFYLAAVADRRWTPDQLISALRRKNGSRMPCSDEEWRKARNALYRLIADVREKLRDGLRDAEADEYNPIISEGGLYRIVAK